LFGRKSDCEIAIRHTDFREAAAFINKIAAPVLNKMFDCGMIP
jgi:hypothetical protein